MAAANYKIPPTFDEGKPYESWKNEVQMWTRVTELGKKKQALAVALALTGRARETAMEVPIDDLNKDAGMTTLLDALDKLFLKEEKDVTYEAYSNFDRITRDSDVSMTDYIIDFEKRYLRMRKYKMELPDAVLAFKLLDTACIEVKDRQLALTACTDLTFASMKSGLKRIFGGKTSAKMMGINQDIAYVATEQRRQRSRSSWPEGEQSKTPLPGTNPLDKHGSRSKCAICQSTFHWAKDCPHKGEQVTLTQDIDECNITLFTKESHTDAEIFLTECFSSAIIDTACTHTVCGEEWLDSYITGLSKSESEKMKRTEQRSNRPFKFGDGKVVHATRTLKIPAKIGQTKCNIETEVVPVKIPLLLSKSSMKKAGTVLNMENGSAVMFNQPVQLDFASSGHYCVNIMDTGGEPSKSDDCVLVATGGGTSNEHSDEDILAVSENMSKAEKQKMLVKLHRQFGHASAELLMGGLMAALRKQLRSTNERYEMGDKVYYKRGDCPEWKGPGTVIGQDGAVVFVRHGGTCVRVHYLRLMKERNEADEQQAVNDNSESTTDFGQRHNLTVAADNMDHDDDAAEDHTSDDSDMDDTRTGVETQTQDKGALAPDGYAL